MRILAIETSSPTYSAALLDENSCVAAIRGPSIKTFEPGSGSSAQLLPAIKSLFRDVNWEMEELGGIGVSVGPGSFTGLRVGLVAAKCLAYALKKPIVSVNTLAVLADQAFESREGVIDGQLVRAVTNAQRKQVFCSAFRVFRNALPQPVDGLRIVNNEEWMQLVQPGDLLTGSGLKPIVSELTEQSEFKVVSSELWVPRAETVGKLARLRFQNGETDDLWSLKPLYFRPSAAEEKKRNQAAK